MEKPANLEAQKICGLHDCLRKPILLCRCAGLFPVDGLTSFTNSSLRCCFKLPYIVFYVASIFGQILITGFAVFWFFLNTFSLNTLVILLFYTNGLIATILLLILALKFTKIMKKATKIEANLEELQKCERRLWKYSVTTYVVMALALLEHILSILSKSCKVMIDLNEYEITKKVVEEYFTSTADFIFNFTSFSLLKGALLTIANVQATFMWNITDVMTICLSIYLTSYFQELNKVIKRHDSYKSISWERVRVLYSHLVALVKEVDTRFCNFVLLSFFTNLFFICLQMFYVLNFGIPGADMIENNNSFCSTAHLFYYNFSIAFIITRASMMCLLAANVHKTAQEPMFVVGHIPSSDYTLDVQRFSRQLRYTTNALSGVYFYVTRSTLLNVVGIIFTYELVLLQFNLQHKGTKN